MPAAGVYNKVGHSTLLIAALKARLFTYIELIPFIYLVKH